MPTECPRPVVMDWGRNKETLLLDPLYLGLRQTRPTVAELDDFVDEFVAAVQEEFPNCCIQFEDWAGSDAIRLLARYRDKVCCFNDDIQGTAAVAIAGLLGAMRIVGGRLAQQKVLFLGAGSAGIWIAGMLTQKMKLWDGLSTEEARPRNLVFAFYRAFGTTRTRPARFPKPYA